MNLRKKFSRRIFAGVSLAFLGVSSLIAYSVIRHAIAEEELKEEQEEREGRSEGLRFRRLSLQDENGVIDPEGLRKARQHISEMKKVQGARRLKRQGQIEEAGIQSDSWTWLGPGNIGGRIRSISINPANANDMLVGSVSGGIWRTLDGGLGWFPVADFMVNLAVSTIVRSPTNTALLYAGTGEGFTNLDAIQGAGIFQSFDNGASWNQLLATNNANFNFVNRLAISPNGATLLAATNSGIWRSTDGGATWGGPITNNRSPDIDFHPVDSTRAVAGELGAARYSTDGGQTWTAAIFSPAISNGGTAATNGRVEMAYAPSNPNIVYAGVNNNMGDLYRSTDGGQNYTRVNSGLNYMGNQGWYDNALWVNPNDANAIIVGGVHLWQSSSAGASFFPISDGSDSAHADHHCIVQHPGFNNTTNRTVFFGNDGGIYRADDLLTVTQNSGWTERNNALGITQFYSVAGNQTSGLIVGGTQDNGTILFSGNTENWTSMQGSDGGFVAADQTDPNYFYGETQNLQVVRSTNAGVSSTPITSGLGDFTGISCTTCQTNFIAPLVIDPNEPNRLLAGGWSLWRTNNAKAATPQWTGIKLSNGAPITPNDQRSISSIAINPNNSDFVVVGHNNGDIFLNLNATNANPIPGWNQIDTAGLPNRMVTRLTWDPNRAPNWIYATFGGFMADNVYVTRDLGATWIDITGVDSTGLPNVPVRTLVFHPSNANLLYVGTEVGIFTSPDAGATWDPIQDGPANVSVDELFWMGGDLFAATHGRGLYRASGGFYVDCNFIGGNGSFLQPFRTINDAINALPANSYRPIWLKPGCTSYNEQINSVGKRFELRTLGAPIRIGP